MSAPRPDRRLAVEPLTRQAFKPFGTVIETDDAQRRLINGGTTERFHALATADVETQGGRAVLSIFRGQPRAFPYTVVMMERHPLASQAFYPLGNRPWLVVVAADEAGRPAAPRAYLAGRGQGVQYGRGVWHHPLIAVGAVSDFLIVDREGPGDNLEEIDYPEAFVIDCPAV